MEDVERMVRKKKGGRSEAQDAMSLFAKMSLKKRRSGDMWDRHHAAFCDFVTRNSLEATVSTKPTDITKNRHFGRAVLRNGDSATSARRDEYALLTCLPPSEGHPSRAHISSYALCDEKHLDPDSLTPRTPRLVRAIVFFRCDEAASCFDTPLFIVADVYAPLVDIYDGAATYAPGPPLATVVLPLIALSEVVGVYRTQDESSTYVLRRQYIFVEMEKEEKAQEEEAESED